MKKKKTKKRKDSKPMTQYFVWQIGESGELGYWCCFDKLEDCLDCDSKGTAVVYSAKLKRVGKFKLGMVEVK